MRIAGERSLVADLAQEVAHAVMVLEVPRRQVRWQPLELERPGGRARRERSCEDRPEHSGIALGSDPQPII